MTLRVRCPCGANCKVSPKLAGKQVKCPKCARLLSVPASSPSPTKIPPETHAPSVAGSSGSPPKRKDAASSKDSERLQNLGCLGVGIFGIVFLVALVMLIIKLQHIFPPLTPERVVEIQQPETEKIIRSMSGAEVSGKGNVLRATEEVTTFLVQPGPSLKIKFPAVTTVRGYYSVRDSKCVVSGGEGGPRTIEKAGRTKPDWGNEIRATGFITSEDQVEPELEFPLSLRPEDRHRVLQLKAEVEIIYPALTNDPQFTNRSKHLVRECKLIVVSAEEVQLHIDQEAYRQYMKAASTPWWLVLTMFFGSLTGIVGTLEGVHRLIRRGDAARADS